MIDRKLLERYAASFGHTFTVSLWMQRPGEHVNKMMRAALDQGGPAVTDQMLAWELNIRLTG